MPDQTTAASLSCSSSHSLLKAASSRLKPQVRSSLLHFPSHNSMRSIAVLASIISSALRLRAVSSAVVTFEWHVTEFQAAYDGFTRSVYGINGKAGHDTAIEVTLGDTVQVLVINDLNTTTGIHWHGILQAGTPEMDGTSGTTQCGIPPGKSVTYKLKPDRAGTFMWHGHDGSQTMDNLRGPLIVRSSSPSIVDGEYTVQLSEWYHTQSDVLMKAMMMDTSGDEPVWNSVLMNGRGQVNCSALDDGSAPCSSNQSYAQFRFLPTKTYQLRLINIGSYAAFKFSIDDHEFRVVEVDGEDVEPSKMLTSLVINVAQRYSILVTTKSKGELAQGDTRFWMRATAQTGLPWTTLSNAKFPGGFNPNGLGIVTYSAVAAGDPTTTPATTNVTMDELDFVPMKKMQLPDTPDQRIVAQFRMNSMSSSGSMSSGSMPSATMSSGSKSLSAMSSGMSSGAMSSDSKTSSAMSSGMSSGAMSSGSMSSSSMSSGTTPPSAMSMSSGTMSSGRMTTEATSTTDSMASSDMVLASFSIDNKAFTSYKTPEVPTLLAIASGTKVSELPVESNIIELQYGKHVEIVLVNLNSIEHPFHAHGYRPWIVAKGTMPAASSIPSALNLQNPIARDVFTVPPCTTDMNAKCIDVGYVVLRLDASNAGAWIFHCHIDWHMAMGLSTTLVTGSSQLQANGLAGLSSDVVQTCPSTITSESACLRSDDD